MKATWLSSDASGEHGKSTTAKKRSAGDEELKTLVSSILDKALRINKKFKCNPREYFEPNAKSKNLNFENPDTSEEYDLD